MSLVEMKLKNKYWIKNFNPLQNNTGINGIKQEKKKEIFLKIIKKKN